MKQTDPDYDEIMRAQRQKAQEGRKIALEAHKNKRYYSQILKGGLGKSGGHNKRK